MVTSAGLPLELQWSTEKPLSMLSIAGRASLASGPAKETHLAAFEDDKYIRPSMRSDKRHKKTAAAALSERRILIAGTMPGADRRAWVSVR